MKTHTRPEIANLADEAGNIAIAHIQEKLGIPTGDFAGLYFSGNRWDVIMQVLEGYIVSEIMEGHMVSEIMENKDQ